jgi:thiamine monophosphate synthase
MTDPLVLIAGSSPVAARVATAAIRARDIDSPMAQARAARAAQLALGDTTATFSQEERRQIAALLDTRATVFQMRLKSSQKERLAELAEAAGQDMTAYVVERLGL